MALPWAFVYSYEPLAAVWVAGLAFAWFFAIGGEIAEARQFWARPGSRTFALAISLPWLLFPISLWVRPVMVLQAFVMGIWWGLPLEPCDDHCAREGKAQCTQRDKCSGS